MFAILIAPTTGSRNSVGGIKQTYGMALSADDKATLCKKTVLQKCIAQQNFEKSKQSFYLEFCHLHDYDLKC